MVIFAICCVGMCCRESSWLGVVVCYVMRDWLWVAWEDICFIRELREGGGVDVADFLFRDQYFVLAEYLHYRVSQQFIRILLRHVLNSCSLSSLVPYSCLFCSMCIA